MNKQNKLFLPIIFLSLFMTIIAYLFFNNDKINKINYYTYQIESVPFDKLNNNILSNKLFGFHFITNISTLVFVYSTKNLNYLSKDEKVVTIFYPEKNKKSYYKKINFKVINDNNNSKIISYSIYSPNDDDDKDERI